MISDTHTHSNHTHARDEKGGQRALVSGGGGKAGAIVVLACVGSTCVFGCAAVRSSVFVLRCVWHGVSGVQSLNSMRVVS